MAKFVETFFLASGMCFKVGISLKYFLFHEIFGFSVGGENFALVTGKKLAKFSLFDHFWVIFEIFFEKDFFSKIS